MQKRFVDGLCFGTNKCILFGRYDFLYRPSEVTCIHERGKDVSNNSQPFIAAVAIPVPGVPGLVIPAGMAGQCLRVLEDQTSIVLWKVSRFFQNVLL